jgi:endonuclease I
MVAKTLILSQIVYASLDDYSYYSDKLTKNIEKLSKEGLLKASLRNAISDSQRIDISYKEARRHLFGDIHLERDTNGKYFVQDKYCNLKFNSSHRVGPKQIPDAKYINCEHTWPQSRFNPEFSKSLQKNDLHHLYPVKSNANSVRSNHIFGEVIGKVVAQNCQDSRRGTIDYENNQSKAFEPPTEHRGDVARALFYFSVRYNAPISEAEEYYLRRWNKEDPISSEEIKRNQRIFEIQKNRNPFIDDETLVDQIKDF